MQRLRAYRATTPSRGFITRAASALIFIGATALAFAMPGDAAERNSLTPSFSEWRESGSPAPAEENGHWLGADVGTFRINRGDGLHDRIFRAVQSRVHQEPEKAAREVHSLVVGDAAGREKLRQMLLNAAEGKEMMTALDLDSWWQSYTDSYLLDLADAGVNEILQYSEERMLARLGFVKNVNLEYRTPLGGRTGYGALSFLGALAEKEDSVVAWQLRASHNEDAESGLNAGLIFRHARDKYAEGDLFAGHPMLLGLNAFLDFETHAAGNFLRYSIGGEIRTGALDLYGNYYIPLSDTKIDSDNWAHYSAEGFDVEANVGVPGADWLSGVVGYYWWEGEGTLDDEEGTKFGFRARPNTSWEFEFEYDLANEGDQEIGGRLSYTRQIGDQPSFNVSSRPFGGNFNPRNHFYDIVRREYAQRIRSYLAGPSDPVVIPTASSVPGMVEIAGIVTLTPANTGVNASLGVTYPIVGMATVVVSGNDAVIGLGFGSDDASGTVGFTAGEYVFDIDAQAIIVGNAGKSGNLYWDDPSAKWAADVGDSAGSTVALFGTGLTMDVASGVVSGFRLYEGQAEAPGSTPDAPLALDCDPGSATSAAPAEGRVRTGTYITECYGDLATGSGAGLILDGTALETEKDYQNPTRAVLSGGAAALLTMQGKGRGNGSPVVSFPTEATAQIQNDVAGGVRFVDGEGFAIDNQVIGCDFRNDTIYNLANGVAGYCLAGLTEWDAYVPPVVGIASGYSSGGVVLTVSPLAALMGVGDVLSYTVAAEGFSVNDNGVLSIDSAGVSALSGGANAINLGRNFDLSVPGSDLDLNGDLNLNVHKVAETGSFVILVNRHSSDPDPAKQNPFPNGTGISKDGFEFTFEDPIGVTGADTGNLPNGVSYDVNANEFSIGSAALPESVIGDYAMVVTMTASNMRGTHVMTVNVRVVNKAVVGQVVSPVNNIAAGEGFTGDIGETAGLRNSSGKVTFDCVAVGGANQGDFAVSPMSDGCAVNLNSALGSADANKVVHVEVTHTPTGAYVTELLAPFGGTQPDGSGTDVAPLVLTAQITVWRVENPVQPRNTTSKDPIAGLSFDTPASPSGEIDFTGGTWSQIDINDPVGASDASRTYVALAIDEAGAVTGTPGDANESVDEEYTIDLVAGFMHDALAGVLTVEMSLLVEDFTAPSTIQFSAGANGNLYASVDGVSITSGDEANKGQIIRFFAVPNPGFHVEAGSWNDSGSSGADACADAPDGQGGPKTCVVTAGNGLSYNVSVAFVAGALPADIPETGDVPATGVDGVVACLALGGEYTALATSDSCSNFGPSGSCVIASAQSGVDANCQAAFNDVRNCNLENKAYDSASSGCAANACGSGEVAIGGNCVAAVGSYQVSYTQSELDVRRVSDGSEVASGSYVASSVFLSVTATPSGDSKYVAGWGGDVMCVNQMFASGNAGLHKFDGFEGSFEDTGAKLCVFPVTMAVNLSVKIASVPKINNVVVSYPEFSTLPLISGGSLAQLGAGADAAEHQKNCELFGGVYEATGLSGARLTCARLSAEYDAAQFNFASCEHEEVGGAPPNCGVQFNAMRACLIANKPVLSIVDDGTGALEANCGDVCPDGQLAKAGACTQLLVSGLSGQILPNDGAALAAPRVAAVAFHPELSDKKKEENNALIGVEAEVRFSGGGRFGFPSMIPQGAVPFAQRDALLAVVPTTGPIVSSEEICLAFNGVYDAAGTGFCIGIANPNLAAFCQIGPGCNALFGRVRDCNLNHNRRGGGYGAAPGGCGAECGGELSAVGNNCVYEKGGVIQTSQGELPPGIPASGPIVSSEETCLAFDGVYDAAGTGFCIGIANPNLAAFCQIGPGCNALLGRVRDCNLINRRGGGYGAAPGGCGAACEYGSVARGNKCVAPSAVDGIQINEPTGEGVLSSDGGLTVGANDEAVDGQTYVLTAQPDAGYHVARWTGACGEGGLHEAQASPYRSNAQICSVTKAEGDGLEVGVVFARGLLDADVPVTGDITPSAAVCTGLGGDQRMTLSGSDQVSYCDNFNQRTTVVLSSSGGNPVLGLRDEQDENIEDQCWISGGFLGTDTDDSLAGNIQDCRSAFVVARECNKLNMRSASILPKPAPTDEECDAGDGNSGGGPDTCAPQAFARGDNNQAPDGQLCGDMCPEGQIAQGGDCVAPGTIDAVQN